MTKENLLEAILFSESEPITIDRLAVLISSDKDATTSALNDLKNSLENRGLVLIESNQGFALGTHPEAGKVLEAIRKDELTRELSKSAVETLAIILYGRNISKGDIDFIRGVNSGFILRNLSIRGLVEKGIDEHDGRKYIYKPTIELMQSLGITGENDLENLEEIRGVLEGRIISNDQLLMTND